MSKSDLQPYELMHKAADLFDRLGIAYRIVGSMASIAYGETRFTNDIDILVDLAEDHITPMVNEFNGPDFYLSEDAILNVIRDRRQFSIIHVPSGLKLDIILRKDTEFGTLDITQGQLLKSEGYYNAWFASPENVILMKLRFYKQSGSDNHLRDISGILLIQGSAIDRNYLANWSDKLGVAQEWNLVSHAK